MEQRKAISEDDIEEFGEWISNQAEARGIALIAFVGLGAKSGSDTIDFEPFQTSLSLKNIEKLEESITSMSKKELLEEIMEEVKSALDSHMYYPIATLLGM